MKTNKGVRIAFWISTTIIFLFEGVLVALTSQTEFAKQGIAHLGYPAYFGVMLAVFKVLGAIVLILPMVPRITKEWAYAGFAFTMFAAFVSHFMVDGVTGQAIFPLAFMAILAVSYITYGRLAVARA